VFDLADTLEVLNLSGNQLTSLPRDLPCLHRLKAIFCSDNAFAHLPDVLGECPSLEVVGFKANRITEVPGAALPLSLRWLILTDNAVRILPPELGQRPALQKLMLAGNLLGSLPTTLANAQRLELVRLAANQLPVLPAWLLELPRLSWLALAGNPLGWHRPSPVPIERMGWHQLQQCELLGEGASGLIYRVQPHDGGAGLALKLFKGAVTSDGLPEHELAACLAAGQHPSLCTPQAELANHPQGRRGLLLPLIPGSHTNLAGPPSLDSCTRDIYPTGLRITAANVLRLAQDVAGAMAHLHQQGVMHGDLYAHNILWNPANGRAVLSDFGAATLLPVNQPRLSLALQALEVRAFGHLLEELLVCALPTDEHTRALASMTAMAQACLALQAADRPGMTELAQLLAAG
jgi:hypothetical protein